MKRFFTLKNIFTVIFALLIAADMIFIWFNSSQNGHESDNRSKEIAETVAKAVVRDYEKLDEPKKQEILVKTDGIVRESAHLLEFVPLGMFLAALILLRAAPKRASGILAAAGITLLSGALYALSDEIHQTLIEGRGFQLFDIMMDSCGCLLGMAVCLAVYLILIKKKSKKRTVVKKEKQKLRQFT